jgi:hypothetical protein
MKLTSAACSPEEKRAALEIVLASQSFDRSDQLKRFLRYVCEMEISGHASELTEYRIGVDGLGRPESFSPNDDSIVRNRAYAVRKKLEEHYSTETSNATLRIVLPKGNYIPKFLGRAVTEEEVVTADIVPEDTEPAPLVLPVAAVSPRPKHAAVIIAALLAGIALGAGLLYLAVGSRIRPETPVVFQGPWGPLLKPGHNVLVSIATPPQAYIREFPEPNPPIPGLHPVEKSVVDWYRKQRPELGDKTLLEVPTFNSPLWGDAAGAFQVASFLRGFGATTELIAERLVTPPVFRNRNVVFFGGPEYSSTITRLMQNLPLQVGYDGLTRDHLAYEQDESGKVIRRFSVKRDPQKQILTEVYGLITILPSEGDGDQSSRYIIFSGVSSAGIQAAAEYLASPSHLAALQQHLQLKSGEAWPARLQILVHATTSQTVTLSFAYETHRIVK